MMRKLRVHIFVWALLLMFLHKGTGFAQHSGVDLQVEFSPFLTPSELVELINLGRGERAPGSNILKITIQNNSSETREDLYLDIMLYTGNSGVLMETYQRSGHPFSLQPGRFAVAAIDPISRGRLQGISDRIPFDGDLSVEGRRLITNILTRGLTPDNEFTLEIGVYAGDNRPDGGRQIVREIVSTSLEALGGGYTDPDTGDDPGDEDHGGDDQNGQQSGRDQDRNDTDEDRGTDEQDGAQNEREEDQERNGQDRGEDSGEGRDAGQEEQEPDAEQEADREFRPGRSQDRLSPSILLESPGGELGGGVENVSNPYPEFRWDGLSDQTYRVIVVESRPGQTPESLIQGALGTSPAPLGESASLLEFEMADLIVDGRGFQYPSTGVQQFQSDQEYYWQTFIYEGSFSTPETSSEIWSFRLTDGAGPETVISAGLNDQTEASELRQLLVSLLGMDEVRQLERDNLQLMEIELDGRQLTGELAVEELYRILEKVRSGTIKMNNNQ